MPASAEKARDAAAETLSTGALDLYLGYHLRQAQIAVFQHFKRGLSAQGVTPGQFGLLMLLAANPGVTQVELCRATGRDKSTLTAALERLTERGLINRRRLAADRRSYSLQLTASGEQVLRQLQFAVVRHEDEIASSLSPTERRTMIAMLRKVRDAASKRR